MYNPAVIHPAAIPIKQLSGGNVQLDCNHMYNIIIIGLLLATLYILLKK